MKCSILLIVFLICAVHFTHGTAPRELCASLKTLEVKATYVDARKIHLFVAEVGEKDDLNYWAAVIEPNVTEYGFDSEVTQATVEKAGLFEQPNFKTVPKAGFSFFSNCIKDYGYLLTEKGPFQFVRGKELMWPTDEKKSPFEFKDGKNLIDYGQIVSVSLIRQSPKPDEEKSGKKEYAIYKVIFAEVKKEKATTEGKASTKKSTASEKGEDEPEPSEGVLKAVYFKVTLGGESGPENPQEQPSPGAPPASSNAKIGDFTEETGLFELVMDGDADGTTIGYQFRGPLSYPIYYNWKGGKLKEYPMVKPDGTFNAELPSLKLKEDWHKRIIPLDSWLNCPVNTFCLGRPPDAVARLAGMYYVFLKDKMYQMEHLAAPIDSFEQEYPPKTLKEMLNGDVERVDVAFGIDSQKQSIRMIVIKEKTLWIYNNQNSTSLEVKDFNFKEFGLTIDNIEAAVTINSHEAVYVFGDYKVHRIDLLSVMNFAGKKSTEQSRAESRKRSEREPNGELRSDGEHFQKSDLTELNAYDDEKEDHRIKSANASSGEKAMYSEQGDDASTRRRGQKPSNVVHRSRRESLEDEESNSPQADSQKPVGDEDEEDDKFKTYEEVNEAFKTQIDLAFLYNEKVVTMVSQFATEQSAYKFYKESENTEFKLLGQYDTKYFGCDKELFTQMVGVEFLKAYSEFAKPSPTSSTTEKPTEVTQGEGNSTDVGDTAPSEKSSVEKGSGDKDIESSASTSMTSVLKSLSFAAFLITFIN